MLRKGDGGLLLIVCRVFIVVLGCGTLRLELIISVQQGGAEQCRVMPGWS